MTFMLLNIAQEGHNMRYLSQLSSWTKQFIKRAVSCSIPNFYSRIVEQINYDACVHKTGIFVKSRSGTTIINQKTPNVQFSTNKIYDNVFINYGPNWRCAYNIVKKPTQSLEKYSFYHQLNYFSVFTACFQYCRRGTDCINIRPSNAYTFGHICSFVSVNICKLCISSVLLQLRYMDTLCKPLCSVFEQNFSHTRQKLNN